MFRRIIVPLDGSPLAERALPVAAQIARASHATLVLLHAVKPLIDYGYTPHPSHTLSFTPALQEQDVESAQNYLTTVSYQEVLAGLKIERVALTGLAVPIILAYTRIHNANLIVMSSHGATGVQRWALGSVAQKVVRQSTAPVLVLHAESPREAEFHPLTERPLRALVALDGSSLAESTLQPTAQVMAALAGPGQAELHLMRIIKRYTDYHHRKINIKVMEHAQQEAASYLNTIATTVSANVKVTSSELISDDIAGTLIEAAEVGIAEGPLEGCDMLALATHGRTGLPHIMMGSITEHILGRTTLPLLVVHPSETQMDQAPLKELVSGNRVSRL